MIHYHGTPFSGAAEEYAEALMGRHAFVSFAAPVALPVVLESCQSFALDNGAFSAWTAGKVPDWARYHEWVAGLHRYPSFDFAVIPDEIEGDEPANDAMLNAWPWRSDGSQGHVGAPVWHLHESLGRLERLAARYPRVCLGSSAQYAQIGTPQWWHRMAEAFNLLCDRDGRLAVKIHGLRMLDPDVFTRFPFASCDSTNVGRNIGLDGAWNGTYQPPSRLWRARVLMARIEAQNSPCRWDRQAVQGSLL